MILVELWTLTLKNKFRLLSMLIVLYFAFTNYAFSQDKVVNGQISKIGDATHIEFTGKSNWLYRVERKSDNKIILVVPPFTSKTLVDFQSWSGGLVESVSVNTRGVDGQYEVEFKLVSDDVESFDYLTDQPSRLILDFYKNINRQSDNPDDVKVAKSLPKSKKQKKKEKAKSAGSKLVERGYLKLDKGRSPAGSELLQADSGAYLKKDSESEGLDLYPKEGVFDGGDTGYDRFLIKDYEIKEEAIIASKQNIYIPFPMLTMTIDRLKQLRKSTPDYKIRERNSKENKEARFLLVLYNKKRYAAFLESYEYFTKAYPNSEYEELLMSVAAEVHLKNYESSKSNFHYNSFNKIYRRLLKKYPATVLAERIHLLHAYLQHEKKDAIETVRNFMQYLKNYQNSDEADTARKALADGYMMLNKPDKALNEYEKIEKTAKKKSFSIEANYRRGDVYFDQKKYDKAIEAYLLSLTKFPRHGFIFPNATYNLAESYFWTGQYKNAIKTYVEFLKRFPSHSHGGYAMTRVGELLDILGADKSRVMGAYLESYFRFKMNQGSQVARIRLLTQRFKGMSEKEVKKALEEMAEIAKKSKLPRMLEFSNLMIADGYHNREDFKKSLETLVTYYQQNPNSSNLVFFRKRILRNIADVIKKGADRKDFMDVLKVSGKFAHTWLRQSDRMDIPFYVAKSYEMAGVYSQSESSYKNLLDKLNRIKGTREHKERKVNEHLPTIDYVRLRLAKSLYAQRKYGESNIVLDKIKDNLKPEEVIEKTELNAMLAMQRGAYKKAKLYLSKLIESWKDQPNLLVSTYLMRAQLDFKLGKYNDVLDGILEIEGYEDDLTEDIQAKALELKADTQLKIGRNISAIETYMRLLDKYEDKRPLKYIRYKVGKILFEKGDIKGAEKVWNILANNEEDKFYSDLAKEQIKNANWQDEYKRYIDRIPAATKK